MGLIPMKCTTPHLLLADVKLCPTYQWHQFHDALRVFEDAVLAENVRADELYVLRNVGFGRPDARDPLLDVVQEALGERGVLVQVHQVRSLEKGMRMKIPYNQRKVKKVARFL